MFYPPRKQNFMQQEVIPTQQRSSGFGSWGSYSGNYADPQRANYNNWGSNNQKRSNDPLPGKIISSLDDIKPNDIPGDGQVAWFPADDYSCVIARGWATTGDRIEMRKYVPEEASKPEQPSIESILMGMAQKLNQMEKLLIANGFTFPETETSKNDISPKTEVKE